MRIAIDNCNPGSAEGSAISAFMWELAQRMAGWKTADKFFVLHQPGAAPAASILPNLEAIELKKVANGFLGKFRSEMERAAALRRLKPDVILRSDNKAKFATPVPRVMLCVNWYNTANSHSKQPAHSGSPALAPEVVKKTSGFITFSAAEKAAMLRHFSLEPTIIQVCPLPAPGCCSPLEWEERERIKGDVTGGREYFFFHGDLHPASNLINLLKAFSLFKKRQQSNMQLVISSPGGTDSLDLAGKLENYKYKSEVLVLQRTADVPSLMAAAYAVVMPAYHYGFPGQAAAAMQSGVPLLLSTIPALEEICGDAALFFNPDSPEEIAQQLKLVFKDESLRSVLIAKGQNLQAKNKWEKVISAIYETARTACNSAAMPV